MSTEKSTGDPFETPAADAPAAAWGTLAVSIPGWRWMRGMYAVSTPGRHLHVSFPKSAAWWLKTHEAWPDPDDPATEGCLLMLLGLSMPDWWVATTVRDDGIHIVRASKWGHVRVEAKGRTLGRACIATAAVLGRWPGGEG